jgi:hypothetical protein
MGTMMIASLWLVSVLQNGLLFGTLPTLIPLGLFGLLYKWLKEEE